VKTAFDWLNIGIVRVMKGTQWPIVESDSVRLTIV